MTNLNNIISGLKKFLENELIERVTGWQKWAVGAGVSMILENGANVFNTLKTNPVIQAMQIITNDDEIDIDRIYKHLIDQARKSAVTFQLPLVGAITLKADDVEKIYTYIKGE